VGGPQLAHLNIAHMRAPMDSASMAGFAAQLDSINALADTSPGFVWRLEDEDPNDPAVRALGTSTLINLSVWRDARSLADFVYRSAHSGVMRRRREQGATAQAFTFRSQFPPVPLLPSCHILATDLT
jgi:hypothetical protein